MAEEEQEKRFRRHNNWHSFMGALYSGVGLATLIGAVGAVASGLAKGAAVIGSPALLEAAKLTAVPTTQAFFAAAGLTGFAPLVLLGVVAIGVTAIYLAQTEFTEARLLQDKNLAEQQAKCSAMAKELEKTVSKEAAVEYEQNCRAAGKPLWTEEVNPATVAQQRAAQPQIATR